MHGSSGEKKCRICNHALSGSVLEFKNMPAIAQNLPDADSLISDKGISFSLYQCTCCGLIQLVDKPVFYYKEVVRATGLSSEMRGFRKKHFSSFIRKYGLRGKKVIEIGCGTGENLALMEECGMRAYGIEYSSCGVKKCIRDGLRASKEFITSENYRNTNGPFDSFYILSFLEHLPNPNTILGGIRNNLRDNAVGIVEVPNFDMIIKNHLFSEFMIDHLYYFTRKTLSTTLEINGFDVLECRPVFHDYIISAVVKKRSIANFSHFQEKKNQIKIEINKFINRFKSHKVGVWGAGHQSLAVLSSLNLGKDIKYVIDSAKFKQGKFTPVTHIPIVSPSELDDNPVEAIIIIAGSYSDEVVKLLNSKIKNKPKSIAILRESGLEII